MSNRDKQAPGPQSQALAALERDAAFGRISRTRRWLIGAAAALTAAFAALVSAVSPGRAASHSSAASGARAGVAATGSGSGKTARTGSSAKMPPLAGPDQLGLQAPGSAPSAAPAAPAAPAPTQPAPAPVQSAPAAPAQAPAPAAVSGGS